MWHFYAELHIQGVKQSEQLEHSESNIFSCQVVSILEPRYCKTKTGTVVNHKNNDQRQQSRL